MENKNISGVIAIDDGGFSTCVKSKKFAESFPSVKGVYGNRKLTSTDGKYDFIVEYKNKKYVAGTLAEDDCALPLQMHTESKQNLFFDLSVLIAIHQYGYYSNQIVVSVPIEMHTDDEKNGRFNRLKGSHTLTVKGVSKTFVITDVKVAPESASAYWIDEPDGITRYLDLGSRTIGYATTLKKNGESRFIDTQSGTIFDKGLQALGKHYDASGLADYICGRLMAVWNESDKVRLIGGGALDEKLVGYIKQYFPNAEIMDKPHMANVEGMYNLGRLNYGMD